MKIQNYKELKVWGKGIDIVHKVYELTKNFPNQEKFALVPQMRRSAVSIPSNIAEGFMRHHTKEYIRFLFIALSSCAELETQLIISNKQGYLTDKRLTELQEDIDHENRMLMNLIKNLN